MSRRNWWILLLMIPLGMVAGLILARVHLYLVPRVYESEVILQFRQRSESFQIKQAIQSEVEPQYMMGTEFEPFKSRTILLKVNEKLKLETSWGVDEDTVVARLKSAVQVIRIRETDLLCVKVRVADPVEARDIALELATTYREWRTEMEKESNDRMLVDLRRAVQKQEEEVEQARKELKSISENTDSDTTVNDSDYFAAKTNFEQKVDILVQMEFKLVNMEIESRIIEVRVVVHDEPEIPNNPVGMSERLIMLIWMVGGALLAPLVALPIMSYLNRSRRPEISG